MRKITEVLRLAHACGFSTRQIARSLAISRASVQDYLRRASVAGLGWPLPDDVDDEELYRRLFPPAAPGGVRPEPDWGSIWQDLHKPNVTLRLLWEEYRGDHPDGYGQSRFYELFREWQRRLAPSMRQTHVGGEKLFVDYAGATVPITDTTTGTVREAQVFVAVLGASSYTYAEVTWTQSLGDWCASHARALAFFGGVPRQLVSDNLKAGITKACYHEPQANRTYADLAAHYGSAILPARPRRPRDKAKVEVGVQVVERWILARLRKQSFFCLAEVNAEIGRLLQDLNDRRTRHLRASRRELFISLDAPALGALPPEPYEFAEWHEKRVGLDYHVEIHDHFYSVPSRLVREPISVRSTAQVVEMFHKGRRVAVHVRRPPDRLQTTLAEHMPGSHRRYAEMTPGRVRDAAARIGPNTAGLVEAILRDRPHPEQGFRACLGILRLARTHGAARLEAACERALAIRAHSYSSVTSILKNNLERRHPETAPEGPPIVHSNIRGPRYYH